MTEWSFEDFSEMTAVRRKAVARYCWERLPSVIRDIFANAPKRAMYEVLKSLGVEAAPARSVEWAYTATDGSLVVTIWHDQIQSTTDGTIGYYIPVSKWRRSGIQEQRADQFRALLLRHSGCRPGPCCFGTSGMRRTRSSPKSAC